MAGETKLKAFEFVKEWTTQLITVASASLVLSATFYKDMVKGSPSYPTFLELSWFLFLISIVLGIMVLGALSAKLNKATEAADLDVYAVSIKRVSLLQIFAFVVALLLFTVFVAYNMEPAQSDVESGASSLSEVRIEPSSPALTPKSPMVKTEPVVPSPLPAQK